MSSPSPSPGSAVATGADGVLGVATAVMRVVGTDTDAAVEDGASAADEDAGVADDAGALGETVEDAGGEPEEPPLQTTGPGAW